MADCGTVLKAALLVGVVGGGSIFAVTLYGLPADDGPGAHVTDRDEEPNRTADVDGSLENAQVDDVESPNPRSEARVMGPDDLTYPTDRRYANLYGGAGDPTWRPETDLNLSGLYSRAGLVEVTRYPGAKPTRGHLEGAWRLYNESYKAARANGWFHFANASRDGYRVNDFVHYANPDHYLDNATLAVSRPESLVYYDAPSSGHEEDEKILAGFMYVTSSLREEGPQVGGPLTVWHYHPRSTKRCFRSRLSDARDVDGVSCPDGATRMYRGAEMLHVWFVKHPGGPFSSDMAISKEYIREPDKMTKEEFLNYTRDTFRSAR